MEFFKINKYEIYGEEIYSVLNKKSYEVNKLVRQKFRKKVFIVCEEQIYIKSITLPRACENSLEALIEEELKFYYRYKENIIFTYEKIKEDKNNFELLVYYINLKEPEKETLKHIANIKAIYLVQFIYINFVNNKFKYNNFVIAFFKRECLYILYCENRILKANEVYRKYKDKNIINAITKFYEVNNINASGIEKLIVFYSKADFKEGLSNKSNILTLEDINEV